MVQTITRRLILGTAAAAPFAGASRAAEAPIKIGMTTDLTGIAAAYTRGQVDAVQLALGEVNAAGGLLGRQVELVVRDSQLKPDLGASHTRDLILREKVDFLIGPDASSVGVAVSNVAKQYKKIVMMTIPNTPRLVGELFHPDFFTIVPSGTMLARAMAEGIDRKYKNIAFIGADYEAPHQAVKYFTEWLAHVNPDAKVATTQFPKLGEPDFTPYITQILSAKPDFIYSYLWGADIISFIKQAKPYGLFERTQFGTLLFIDDLKALGAEMPDGIIGQMYASPFVPTPAMAAFITKFSAKYNSFPSEWALMSYDGAMILAQAIAAAKSVDQDAVRTALMALQYHGLQGGTTTFRAVDHQGNVPSYLGRTARDPKLPFKTLTDLKRIEADTVWPTPEEILSERKA